MDLIFNFPAFTILISLLCSGIGYAMKKKNYAKILALCLYFFCLALNIITLFYCIKNGSFTYRMGHFSAPWGNEIRAGITETLMASVFNVVMLLSVIGGFKSIERDIDESKINLYFVMMNLVNASLMALIYTNDIFTGYVFIEICTLASTGILMIREIGRTTLAATRYMIFSLIGSGLFLIGVILLYCITGHLLMPNIFTAVNKLYETGLYHLPLTVVIGLISMGIAIKSGLFPFHFWMPDTYGCATPTSSGVLSGLISKGYIFLLIKIIIRCFGVGVFYNSGINNVLFIFGICGMVFGSIQAIRENDINRMTAFSSAAQIGYIYMGIGISPALGMVAAIFHILTHALTKPMLFLANDRLAAVSGGSRKFAALRGSAHRNRLAGFAFTMGALSMVGIPGFMGFVSKLMFAQAAIDNRLKMVLTLCALAISTILNTVYFLSTMLTIYASPGAEAATLPHISFKKQMGFTIAILCFIAINLVIGMHSQPIVSLITQGLAAL